MKMLLVCVALLAAAPVARAAVIRTATVGCKAPADALKLAALAGRKDAQDAVAKPLEASRACIPFAKMITVDVDDARPPLVCIRLIGDLSCYWVSASSIDEHPGSTGSGRGAAGGRSNRRAR